MNDYKKFGGYTGEWAEGTGGGSTTGTAITFLLIGAVVGAAVALLFSPVKGGEVRSAISRGYRKTVDGVTERTKDLRERGSNLLGIDRGSEADLQFRRS
jgi:gas vesicle protein